MALETLKGVEEIGGFKVARDPESQKSTHIVINDDHNLIAFRIQKGPVKEKGINGCQVDTMIAAAKIIIEKLNEKLPCDENLYAITKLDHALHWLDVRRKNREKRNVEGTNQA